MKDGTKRLLIFNVQERRYALGLQDVAEVMEPPPTFPIPRAPGWFKGVMNFHGSLVSVLDLAKFLKIGSAVRPGKVLVLDRCIASLALMVDRVETIVSDDNVLGEVAGSEPMVAKVLNTADGEVKLLAVEALLAELEETMNREV
ncbi:MAG: putative CheW [Geobacteraceae bacterium]|nr:MAG: putative CheW [Geobacteraceae bacterium]